MVYQNRIEAGERLAQLLSWYGDQSDVSVVALPRGGVPVAAPVAEALGAPLDVLVVRKLGLPGSEETAMGAIATGGFQYLNQILVQRRELSPEAVGEVIQREERELKRRQRAYRGGLPPLEVKNRTVILIDDGLATGATMRVAIAAMHSHQPQTLIVAVPVASEDICQDLSPTVDKIICAETPQPFYAVGLWYQEFPQTSDQEVQRLLKQARYRTLATASRNC